MKRSTDGEAANRAEVGRHTFAAIIPVHNRQDLATESVRSVLRQTRPAEEIIVVDDGSEPPYRLAGELQDQEGVRIVRVDRNGGAARARNLGVAHATSTHVAFLDSDDLWAPTHLAAITRALRALPGAPAGYSLCRGRFPWPLGMLKLRRIHAHRLGWNSPTWKTSGTVVERATFLSIGGFEETLRFREDTDLFLRLRESGSVARTNRVTVVFRRQRYGLSGEGDRDLARQRTDYLRVLDRQMERAWATDRMTRADEVRMRREFHRYWAARWFAVGAFRCAATEAAMARAASTHQA